MDWTDDGIVLGARRHGESSVILEALTRDHGRHLGLVRGGRAPRLAAVLQPGNGVRLVWRARLSEHLGNFGVEPAQSRAARFLDDRRALAGLTALAALARLLPERDPHPGLHAAMAVVLDHLHEPDISGFLMVRFEFALLAELGFGLDLAECASTGVRERLIYVSPRSGRAVSAEAGAPWKGRLLDLPAFLATAASGRVETPTRADIAAGFRLTGHFLARHVFGPRGVAEPEARARFVSAFGPAHDAV